MNEQEYSIQVLAIGVLVTLAIVCVAIIAFNLGEVSAIIQTEGLLSE